MQSLVRVHIGQPPSYVAGYELVTTQLHRVGLFSMELKQMKQILIKLATQI